jgi:hypothetical protein
MHFAKTLAAGAIMALGMNISAASAASDQVANLNSCMKLSDQVRAALDSNQQSANFDDARQQDRYGREYCTNGFYAKGTIHYERALQLLGVAEQSTSQKS